MVDGYNLANEFASSDTLQTRKMGAYEDDDRSVIDLIVDQIEFANGARAGTSRAPCRRADASLGCVPVTAMRSDPFEQGGFDDAFPARLGSCVDREAQPGCRGDQHHPVPRVGEVLVTFRYCYWMPAPV